jgi:hypothetical protein
MSRTIWARPATWRAIARTLNWGYPVVAAAATLAVLLMLERGTLNVPFERQRLVETILPLLMALQAAYLFAPDDEPALEIIAASPTPLWALVIARLALLLVVYAALALALSLIIGAASAASFSDEPFWIWALRPLAPALMLSAFGLLLALRGRDGALASLLAGGAWFALAWFGHSFAPGAPPLPLIDDLQPYLWPLHAYMQPGYFADLGDYALNRTLVIALGLALGLMALRLLRGARLEWIVFGGKSKSK